MNICEDCYTICEASGDCPICGSSRVGPDPMPLLCLLGVVIVVTLASLPRIISIAAW